MDRPTAEQVSSLVLDFSARLNASIALVQATCSAQEFERYRSAVAIIMGEMLIEIMNPLYAEHPDLKPQGLD